MKLTHYNKAIQRKSLQWWSGFSINEQKALEAKHKVIRITAMPLRSEIARMWELELAEFAGVTQ